MKSSIVHFKNEATSSNKTLTGFAASKASQPFDWDSTLKLKPDPFFDTSRWIRTIGGREIVTGTFDQHKTKAKSPYP
jgi:hypothetical protein